MAAHTAKVEDRDMVKVGIEIGLRLEALVGLWLGLVLALGSYCSSHG